MLGNKIKAVFTSLLLCSALLATAAKPYSVWMADSEMKRMPESWMTDFAKQPKFDYCNGLELGAILKVYHLTGDKKYFNYVKVTAVSGNLLGCDFQQRFVTTPVQNQPYSSRFLECILSMPNASLGGSITFGGTTIIHSYCEKVDIKTIGNATIMVNMFQYCYSLQSVPLFNTIS